ncbi:hypothetical protein [uncultured Rubinisphaera sp.]|uniref:hypothetical protein n=1 Tax=uncultured Rubinisphaera sp. TaxID=1678686 RepID=UPI000EC58B00|nr:hypothetical protein [Planctomycetaceae bacterium]|tara:strand:+ start:7298 stop:7615 length:318 start_codon:yes stop_codon:yes gene_type:complete
MNKYSFTEKLHRNNIYTCILVKGQLTNGKAGYCYFGVFLKDFDSIRLHLESNKPFNPKDFNCIVLARAEGEPTDEVRHFMKRKFSFAEDKTILEISRKSHGTGKN